jgi:hypothetical protein
MFADFLRHSSGVRWREAKRSLATVVARDQMHRRPGYSLSGCVPAEPDSASPGTLSLPGRGLREQPPSDTGVMPRKSIRFGRRAVRQAPRFATGFSSHGNADFLGIHRVSEASPGESYPLENRKSPKKGRVGAALTRRASHRSGSARHNTSLVTRFSPAPGDENKRGQPP